MAATIYIRPPTPAQIAKARAVIEAAKLAWGGKRPGAGRKPAEPRCQCGRHSAKRAAHLRLKCRLIETEKKEMYD